MKRETKLPEGQENVCLQQDINTKDIRRIVEIYNNRPGRLLAILGDIQSKYTYLPEKSLRIVADEAGCSLVDIYSVATFYSSFSLSPRGKHLVCVCLGTACHVRKGAMIAEELERQLGIKAGQTTPDREFTLETVNCLGACAIGPIVTVDGHYFSKVDTSKVKHILEKARTEMLQDDESLAAASDK
jgi:NADH-quinone oxidoreductase subunit E